MRKPVTAKDLQKVQMLKEDDEKKAASREAERKRVEVEREVVERKRMAREDFRWEED